jgi:putative nucleotidyltransferase with HDIG domain
VNAPPRHLSTSFALIVDPTFSVDWETGWAKSWSADHQNSSTDQFRAPIITRSAPEALRYLSSDDVQFGAIYLNALLTPPGVLKLIRMSHKTHPGTPIYIVYDGKDGLACPFSAQELNRLAIQGAMEWQTEAEFLKRLRMPTIDLTQEGISDPGSVTDTASEEFVSIPIQRFNFSAKTFFDVFIRVSGEKFLKIHGAGSGLPEDQLRNYLKKGVTHLYIQRKPHLRCLEYCDLLERTFLTNSGISSAVKISTTLNRGSTTFQMLQNQRKVLEHQVEEIIEFTNDVRRLLSQLHLDKSDDVQAIMQNVTAYEHSLGATVIAQLLAKPLQLENEQSAEILGIASFLHDIGLFRMPPSVQSEDLSQMIGTHRDLFHQHPAEGAQILRDSGAVHPVAIQIVAQHHERRNGSGFPNQLTGQQIHKLSEVVAFSDELARLIHACPGMPLKQVLDEMETKSFEAYSLQIMEAFHKACAPLRQ